MKRIIAALLMLVLLAPALAACTLSRSGATRGLAYYLRDDGTYTVEIGEARYMEKIVIPERHRGKPVTAIGSFGNGEETNSTLKEIVIPAGITYLASDAFKKCSLLEKVYISDLAAWCAIDFCNSWSNPLFCADLYLNGERLTEIVIPEGVTRIGDYAFYSCDSLTKVTIPEGVTSIGESAFSDCAALIEVTIPTGVTSIGKRAFGYCDGLSAVALPDSVTEIGDHAFSGCDSLTEIVIPAGVTSIADSIFAYCNALSAVTIPDSVTRIGEGAFFWCKSLSKVFYRTSDASKWGSIEIGDGNEDLEKATLLAEQK